MARPASASASTALVPVLTLLAGLAVGWATNPFGGEAAQAAQLRASPAAPTPAADTQRREEPAAALDAAALGARTQADVEESAPAATQAPEEVAEEPEGEPVPETLVAELTAILRSGRIETALARDARRMLRYTVEAYLTADAAREALALLDRHPDLDSGLYGRVGFRLLRAGDKEGAALAFLAQLERAGPDEFDVDDLQRLAQADPEAALAFIDARQGMFDEYAERQVQAQRAVLLAQAGQGEASLALLRELASTGELDPGVLQSLGFLPPEQAEAFLRESLTADANGSSTIALAELLQRTERGAEASELLRDLLARQPDNIAALSTLFAIDPESSLQFVDGRAGDLPPRLWAQAGHALQAQGRSGEAVDAWLRAFESDPSDWEVGGALIEHAPAALWARSEQLAANTQDDELLGDLADLNWRAGREELAVELWRRARGIDPGDGEWSGKLRAVALGQDPL